MKKIQINNGSIYGRLTVISESAPSNNARRFLCKCDCGNIVTRSIKALLKDSISSCGCFQNEFNKSERLNQRTENHNYLGTRLYEIWLGIKKRCKNTNHPSFKWYGARGISICSEWDDRFLTFQNWAINNGYADNLSIDRENVDGNYEPSNCRWVEKSFQNNNKRNNRIVSFENKDYTVAQLASKFNIPYTTVINRLNRGLTVKEAVL